MIKHTNVWEMLREVHSYCCATDLEVRSKDDDIRLTIGFVTNVEGNPRCREWCISLADVNRTANDNEGQFFDFTKAATSNLRDYLRKDRVKLAKILSTRWPCIFCANPDAPFEAPTRLTPEQQAEVAAYHASFRDENGNRVWHTGHLRTELLEPPARACILHNKPVKPHVEPLSPVRHTRSEQHVPISETRIDEELPPGDLPVFDRDLEEV